MDLLQGTLEMLVLRTLILAPLHGYGIAKAIHSSSSESLDIEFGSLYPALKRLEAKGWISSKWELSEHNRKAKYYRLTAVGRKQLHREHSKWAEFVSVVEKIMGRFPRKASLEHRKQAQVPLALPAADAGTGHAR